MTFDAMQWRRVVLASLLGVACASCGPELDRISELSTLRIIAVWKSQPYARPGQTVELDMLWEDGTQNGPRTGQVSTFFGFWCVNPPGGQYSGCLGEAPAVAPRFAVNSDTFSVAIPEDSLRPSLSPGMPASGVAYVFYGVCAGALRLGGVEVRPDEPSRTFDLEDLTGSSGGQAGASGVNSEAQAAPALLPSCVDDSGRTLGADDFVIGYSAIQIYEELRNQNPVLLPEFEVDGKKVRVDCVDAACDAPMGIPDVSNCGGSGAPAGMGGASGEALPIACFDSCAADAAIETCPKIPIQAVIRKSTTQEQDPLALGPGGEPLQESIWVSYLVDRGGVSAEVKLVNDPTTGWNAQYGTGYLAPKAPGPVRIWAVVRDNRGGVAWVRLPGYVR